MQQDWQLSEHIDAFRNPVLYPHETDSEIQVLQTHISFVVLTGPFAYKLKKSVDMGFLDFTTLDRRKFYCNEELRLNSAFAPDLYLDVVAVRRDGEHVSLDPHASGEIVEYAVRMRQFDNANLLNRMFERGALDADLIEQLAHTIARAHRSSHRIDDPAFGTCNAMRESVRINKETVNPFVGNTVPGDTWRDLTLFLDTFLQHHEWLFDLRVNEGRIRECHGDLHLGNICVFEGAIELFDRIEFNDAFKNIDVMYDLAFVLMDLRFRERNDLANRLLNAYVESTGDYVGTILLPFYESVRALIRGEVALLLSADKSADTSTRDESRTLALRYLHHALSYAKHDAGMLIVVCGLSGTGKSTFARKLADRGNFLHIRSDAIRKHLAKLNLDETHESLYSEESTTNTYRHLIESGVILAERGHRVILDAQFSRKELRNVLCEKARGFNLEPQFVLCEAPEDVIRKRLLERTGDVSDATADLIPSQRAAFEAFDPQEESALLRLDTTDDNATSTALTQLSS